ncbi:D-2-hydroxyglutarate dehydrogenase YdiJ [Polycladidibacter hongkongensis]|uniref:D-2-hydroxyglutarate dehydrogenase YdiJ n=1 Tax=Polycladidibacter hongkongensis TaxID=1647556 RepID=UPI000832368F|nr:FAD-binding and (Fe-S)-binding domain-containing protein [Pseudovibrio hongkongensis]
MIPQLLPETPTNALHDAFCQELKHGGFQGDIARQQSTRIVQATDNSIYQLIPETVLYPCATSDLVCISKLLSKPQFSELYVAARGGGTGTNGQSLTNGILVDVSRHMNQILEIDPENRRVRVQAGVVKDQLNAALAPYGLFFAPELSTSNRATIGGMISTDASGQGSCLYGKTRDHVLALNVILADGSQLNTEPLDDAQLTQASINSGLAGHVYSQLDELQRANAEVVERQFPKLNRCLTGYDLAHLRNDEGLFDINAVFCGAEGSLGFIAEATLNVLPIPSHSALVVVRYESFDAALRDAPALMSLGAASIETVDEKILTLAQQDIIWREVADFFPKDEGQLAKGVNLVEFVAYSPLDLTSALSRVDQALAKPQTKAGRRGFQILKNRHDIARIWEMRKKSVGLLGNMSGEKRPVAFVEDTAVPPEKLADFIAEFRSILDSYNLDYGMFGHVDAGVLHVRPALDMKAPGAEALVREVTEKVVNLTRSYGGLLWGEHGKGVRSEFSPLYFGELYPVMQQVKRIFDPRNQFNPGKIVAPVEGQLLKIDEVPTKGQRDRIIPAHVRQQSANAVHCNGNGTCFNWDFNDAMCPSWKGTRDRRQSPKGRAQLIREWLAQLSALSVDPWKTALEQRKKNRVLSFSRRLFTSLRSNPTDFSHEVREALDTCLACKSCSGKCPIKVDVPSFRAKFFEVYYGRYLRPLRHYAIGLLESFLPLMSKLPRLSNMLLASPLPHALGLVALPKLSQKSLQAELARRNVSFADPENLSHINETDNHVILVPDPFLAYFDNQVVLDSVDLLQSLGVNVWVAPVLANGKALHVHGFLGTFEKQARASNAKLKELAQSGIALVGLDPSMALVYRSEYREVVGQEQVVQVQLLQEWMLKQDFRQYECHREHVSYRLLSHCTEQAIAPGAIEAWKQVFKKFGIQLSSTKAGCCGMAGTFGHEAANRELSNKIYSLSWKQHLSQHNENQPYLADGFSCRCQVKETEGLHLQHPVSALKSLLCTN